MSTVEIIIYSCLSFVSLSLALGYLIKCRTIDTIDDAIPYVEKHSVELVIPLAANVVATL